MTRTKPLRAPSPGAESARHDATTAPEPSGPGARLRRILLALLVLGIAGLGAELALLGHTESRTQWIPLVALGVGLIATVAFVARPTRASVRALQGVMISFVAAGLAGIVLHYRGNVEFELEMYPDMAGLELFREAMTGATPALAPGALAQLGLLGLVLTYRHPASRSRSTVSNRPKEESP